MTAHNFSRFLGTALLAAFSLILLNPPAIAAEKSKKAGKAPPANPAPKKHPTGYTDTPFLPGDKWRVHDDTRPRPKVVTPGPGYGAPPADAIVLFGGTDLSQWRKSNEAANDWIIRDGYMEVPPSKKDPNNPKKTIKGDLFTKKKFGDIQLHIEWAAPAEVVGDSQGRGNSGVFFCDGVYELQVLDSYNNKSYADGQASALYGWKPPLVNASRKPGEWQTYDIVWEAPRFKKDGKLVKKAHITVLHNGIVTHNRQEYIGATGHKKVGEYKAHPPRGSLKLQDHNNPMRFRNIWVRELDLKANE